MKILLDNNIDHRFSLLIDGHDSAHVRELRWGRLKNGELVRQAASKFDVLITADQNMPFQTPISSLELSVIVVRPRRNTLPFLAELADEIEAALGRAVPGQYVLVPASLD